MLLGSSNDNTMDSLLGCRALSNQPLSPTLSGTASCRLIATPCLQGWRGPSSSGPRRSSTSACANLSSLIPEERASSWRDRLGRYCMCCLQESSPYRMCPMYWTWKFVPDSRKWRSSEQQIG